MPGSGKSTIGRHLARRLGASFFDTDTLIEAQIGCSIQEFFEHSGEARFRAIESAVVAEAIERTNAVIATGGGSILDAANRLALQQRSFCIYLSATPDDLLRRVRNDGRRPLLQCGALEERLRRLHAERHPLYSRTARLTIDMARPSVPAVVDKIVMQLEHDGADDAAGAGFKSD